MEPNPWLVVSSLAFLAPAFTCYMTNNYYLSVIYGVVTFVSSTYHATKYPYLLYIDYPLSQIAHVLTLYRIIPGGWASMPYYSGWLSYAIFIYYYGYKYKIMVWNPDLEMATPWHMSLHISTALTTCYTVYASSHSSTGTTR